jgi:hypothetical protein
MDARRFAVEKIPRPAVEVITVWRDSVLRVDLLGAGAGRRREFCVGEGAKCDVALPPALLGGLVSVPLVAIDGDRVAITLPPDAALELTAADSSPSLTAPGRPRFHLADGARAAIDIGALTFLVRSVERPPQIGASFRMCWADQLWGGASFAFHLLVVFIAFFDVPNLLAMSLDAFDDLGKGVRYAPIEQQKKELARDDRRDDAPSAGKRHRDEEGQAGKRDAPRTNGRYGLKGPRDNPAPRLALFSARDAGILGALPANAIASPFGSEQPLGQDPENALGALIGDRIGDNFGYGGLGIHGTGRGGGGDGRGTIGVGRVETVGGTYAPVLKPRWRPVKLVPPGGVTTGIGLIHGALSKDVIRRVVRRHLNEVQFCYESELAKRPDLAGRVSVKFIINGTGAVQTAVAADSTLGSASLDACITRAVLRWSFPEPEGGGVVIVTYPFQLESSDGE